MFAALQEVWVLEPQALNLSRYCTGVTLSPHDGVECISATSSQYTTVSDSEKDPFWKNRPE